MTNDHPTTSFFGFMSSVEESFLAAGRVRTAETYLSARRSFRHFLGGSDIDMAAIDADLIEAYQSWLRSRGLTPNTVSYYMRILRATYRRAVDAGIASDTRPFRRVYTGVARTPKRALTLSSLRMLKQMELPAGAQLTYARDMFLLSFYLRGMSFIDMAFLRRTDLRAGYITYRRRKTGRALTIKWMPEMQSIIDRYPARATSYLLPILPAGSRNERRAYRNMSYNINRHLKRLGAMLGLEHPLTLYVARHSWATTARMQGVPLGVISESMGHESESTTRIYLASLDTSVVDRANSLVVGAI